MFGLLLSFISLLISFVLPVIATYKSLKSTNPIEDGLKPWIIYWMIFATFQVIENNFYFILKLIPFFNFLKLYFYCWLILPQTQGSKFIYYNYLEPFLQQYEVEFDKLPKNELLSKLRLGSFIREDAAQTESDSSKESYSIMSTTFDNLIKKISDVQTTRQVTDVSLVDSLFGVFQYLPLGSTDQNPPTEASLASVKEVISSSNASDDLTDNDFDVVGKEDLASFSSPEKITSTNEANQGWYDYFWGSSKKQKAE